MFKLAWSNNRSSKDKGERPRDAAPDRDHLKLLVDHFAIGRKVRYFPEYQRDIVFHTIIIAYRVNDHFIYSREDVHKDGAGMPVAFNTGTKQSPLPAGKVARLQLMVPDTTDMERSLDYDRRANLGRNGQFVRGNAITLIADTCQRGVPRMDTQVDSRLRLKEGPYTDNQMILLRPEFDSLMIADQRQKARVQSEIPVKLYLHEDPSPIACTLGDFSDVSLRLTVGGGRKALPPLKLNDKAVVVLDLGDAASTYRIRGVVFRATADSCVIKLKQLYKDGDFSAIKTMDVLEIKTGLLNLNG